MSLGAVCRMGYNTGMRILLFLFLTLVFPSLALAETPDQLAQRVQSVYDKQLSYTAKFEQESFLKATGSGTQASGTVAFKKPGKMHWVYQSPVSQEIISDGKRLWLYQPADSQVLVSDAAKFLKNRASITFLAGQGRLKDEFDTSTTTAPKGASPGTVLQLTPKVADATVSKVLLIIDPVTARVNETWVYDFLGNATRVRFTPTESTRKLEDAYFSFTPPSGVDIIKQ